MGDRFKGTSVEQDVRFKDKEKKLLKTMKFSPILDKKVSLLRFDQHLWHSTGHL